jgi:hypothetical protein
MHTLQKTMSKVYIIYSICLCIQLKTYNYHTIWTLSVILSFILSSFGGGGGGAGYYSRNKMFLKNDTMMDNIQNFFSYIIHHDHKPIDLN